MTDVPPDELYEQRQRTIEWVTSKWKGSQACPICLTMSWTAGNIVELRQFNGGEFVIGGSKSGLYPVAQIICQSCGYTHFFNAVIAGLVDNGKTGAGQQ